MNRDAWMHVRAETDDDFEWLPNPRQKGVLGLPVTDEMIDAWLDTLDEADSLFRGKSGLPWSRSKEEMLNLKKLLSEPPKELKLSIFGPSMIPDKYFEKLTAVDQKKVGRFFEIFGGPDAIAYALWFN